MSKPAFSFSDDAGERIDTTNIKVKWGEMSEPAFSTNDSGERTYFDSGMQRDVTTNKIKWHLVASGPMLRRWAGLLTRGAKKYDDDNWMKANSEAEAKRFRESAFRHFMQWWSNNTDEDHAAAVIFNINGYEYVREVMSASEDSNA